MKKASSVIIPVVAAAILGATVFSGRIAQAAAQFINATIIGPRTIRET